MEKRITIMRNPTGFTMYNGVGWPVHVKGEKNTYFLHFVINEPESEIYTVSLSDSYWMDRGDHRIVAAIGKSYPDAIDNLLLYMENMYRWKIVRFIDYPINWLPEEDKAELVKDGKIAYWQEHEWLAKKTHTINPGDVWIKDNEELRKKYVEGGNLRWGI